MLTQWVFFSAFNNLKTSSAECELSLLRAISTDYVLDRHHRVLCSGGALQTGRSQNAGN